jgi:hypothetical protein
MNKRQRRQLQHAMQKSEDELLNELGQLLEGGLGAAPPPEGFVTRAMKWLRSQEPRIQAVVCGNATIRRLSSGDEEVLLESVAAVVIQHYTGETSAAVAIYVVAYLAKRGIHNYCRPIWES